MLFLEVGAVLQKGASFLLQLFLLGYEAGRIRDDVLHRGPVPGRRPTWGPIKWNTLPPSIQGEELPPSIQGEELPPSNQGDTSRWDFRKPHQGKEIDAGIEKGEGRTKNMQHIKNQAFHRFRGNSS